MSLADAYETVNETAFPFPQCKTCQWYLRLDPDDRAFFDRKAVDPNLVAAKLARACKAQGLDCAFSSFRNHLECHHAIVKEMQA